VVKSVEDAVYADKGSEEQAPQKEIYDYIVLCTKQLPNLVPTPALLEPLITLNHTTIVLFQNGVGIEEPLIAAFPNTPILSSVSMIGSFVKEPNIISHVGRDILQIGAHYHTGCPDSLSAAKLDEFVSLYRDGGAADCTVAPDMRKARWTKLLWNASFNTLCALLLLDVGQIQRSPVARGKVIGIMREIAAVAEKDG
jgi:2-dehydropantoate 2-reductase